jgi:hypothetical protein
MIIIVFGQNITILPPNLHGSAHLVHSLAKFFLTALVHLLGKPFFGPFIWTNFPHLI